MREFGETLEAMDQLRRTWPGPWRASGPWSGSGDLELAALTHDLKTPLTVISGNAELLEEDPLTPPQREMADAILHSALRLQDYVAQLRAMTGRDMAPGRERETVSLEDLVDGWRGIGQSLCAGKQIAFRCPAAPALSLTVDRASLDRAVSNLLDNAARYTPAGGAVSLAVSADEKALTIAVEDTGH